MKLNFYFIRVLLILTILGIGVHIVIAEECSGDECLDDMSNTLTRDLLETGLDPFESPSSTFGFFKTILGDTILSEDLQNLKNNNPEYQCPPLKTDGTPIKATDGNVYKIEKNYPHISSGSLCRGACGADCENCEQIGLWFDCPGGKCGYQVLRCPCHQGCIDHDNCYDNCAENGEGNWCKRKCDKEAYDQYGYDNVKQWLFSKAITTGGYYRYYVDPSEVGEFQPDYQDRQQNLDNTQNKIKNARLLLDLASGFLG